MTPASHWAEHDYYRASRAARAAWQHTSQQLALELPLDETADALPTTPRVIDGLVERHARDVAATEPRHNRTCQEPPTAQAPVVAAPHLTGGASVAAHPTRRR